MKAWERLINYVTVRTPSDEESETVPSSVCQFDLARKLEKEMKELGLTEVVLDDKCYLYGKLPATEGKKEIPALGFIAHMDTVSDFCDHEIRPMVTKNYDGGDLVLGTSGLVLSPNEFPHLTGLKGRTLLTSDGTTILGADDKAGIAEILTAVEDLSDIPHGPISVAFTPDEEIGTGASHFDVKRFGATYAYTLDGDTEGEIQFETFNAAQAKLTFHGTNVHPGSAKNIMVNAALVAMEYDSLLPAAERPERTEDYEGFYHLTHMEGGVSDASLTYILRDHDAQVFDNRQRTMRQAAKFINERYGAGTVELDIRVQYRNMAEVIEKCPSIVENAKKACKAAGVEELILPVRGGTDGSTLSFMGLPCPNLGTGGHAYHGPYEHITLEGMDQSIQVIRELIRIFGEQE